MKELGKRFERLMMAVAFAESGEHETAREIMKESDRRSMDRPELSRRPKKEYRAEAPRR